MKLSIEQVNKLLSQLTAGVTVVEDEQTADTDADIQSVITNINDVLSKDLKPILTEEVKSAAESAFTARYLGALRSAAHRVFFIPRKELEDLSLEQMLSKCKGAIDSRYNQTEAEKQTLLEATVQDYEQQLEILKAQHKDELAAESDKYRQKDITSRCVSIIQQLPRKGGDIDEQAEMLKYKMQKVYEVRYNESSGKLEFFKEGQPAMVGDNKPVTDEDFAREWAERTGILMRDTRHILPSDIGTEPWPVLNTTDTEQPGMNAIEAWAEG